jgi:hypothetical protein
MAYTKYSLTPADNNAAPPNGAPEGMLPSAVNDTMRDMMSQIRDVGDGIRGGTYTMTAPVITGGSISGLSSFASTGVATFSAGSVSAPSITTTGDTNTGIFFPAADTIAFTEGGVEAMRINSAGDVGIGTSSPSGRLHIAGGDVVIQTADPGNRLIRTSVAGGAIQFRGSSATADRYLALGTVNNAATFEERMRIDSAGNVGIGTASPAVRLEFSSTSAASYSRSFWNANNTDSGEVERGGYEISTKNFAATQRSWGVYGFTSGLNSGFNAGLTFKTVNGGTTAERMRITSDGLFLVGCTSFPGAGTTTAGAAFGSNGAVSAFRTSSTPCFFGRGNDGEVMALYSGATQRGQVSISGATTTYGSFSDYRLKENVTPLTDAIAKVMSLKPSTFNFIEFPEQTINGFIAHEVAEVEPIAVTGQKDAVDKNGKPLYQSVDPAKLVSLLTAAIQEQQSLIENLTTRLNVLEGN